jgi:metal-responsive CopG/Arc/MetJ family transcriptional regulator
MVDGFTSISIADPIIKRVDKIFKKARFNTRSGYIIYQLRKALEQDEIKYGGGDKTERHSNNI